MTRTRGGAGDPLKGKWVILKPNGLLSKIAGYDRPPYLTLEGCQKTARFSDLMFVVNGLSKEERTELHSYFADKSTVKMPTFVQLTVVESDSDGEWTEAEEQEVMDHIKHRRVWGMGKGGCKAVEHCICCESEVKDGEAVEPVEGPGRCVVCGGDSGEDGDNEDDGAYGEENGEEETANDGDATAERATDGEASDDGADLEGTGASANDDGLEEKGSAEEFQKLMDQCGGDATRFMQSVRSQIGQEVDRFTKDAKAKADKFTKNMETYATNAAVFAMEHKRAAGGESELAECFEARESNLKRIADYEKKRDSLGGNEGDPVYAGARKLFEDGIAQCQSDLSNANEKIEKELRGNKRRCMGRKAGNSTPDAAKEAADAVINEYLAPEKLDYEAQP